MSVKLLRIIMPVVLGLVVVGTAGADDETDTLRAKYVKEIDMDQGPLARGMDALMQFFTPAGREAQNILKDVRSIKMAVYDTYDVDNEERALRYLMEDLRDEGWETALKVRERDEQVWIMFRSGAASIRDVYIVSINPDELIQVRESRPASRMLADVIEHSDWDHDEDNDEDWDRPSYWQYRSWESRTAALGDLWPDGYDDAHIRYNRVDGAYTGFRLRGNYHSRFGMTRYGEIGYAFGRKKWQYQAGGEMFNFLSRSHMISAGFEVHDRTDTQDEWIVGEWENTLGSALFREDYRDYYRAKGMSAYGAYNLGRAVQLNVRYIRDDVASLANTVNWSLFEHKYANTSFRPNPIIDEGQINSVRAGIRVDTRTSRSHSRRGWLLDGSFERAGGTFGGDYGFDRYMVDLRRNQPIGRGTRLDLRARFGGGDGTLPIQYLYDLGGISTLRGYGYKAFTGDRMMLFNAEYWIDDDMWGGQWPMDMFTVGGFFDAGTAWFSKTPTGLPPGTLVQLKQDFRYSAGIGVDVEGLRFYFARQIDSVDKDWKVSLRVKRSF